MTRGRPWCAWPGKSEPNYEPAHLAAAGARGRAGKPGGRTGAAGGQSEKASNWRRACRDQHGKGCQAVIREGEAYLQRHAQSPIQAEVQIMIGRAFGDIVALVAGFGDLEPADLAAYRAQAEQARRRAIESFRAAQQTDPEVFRMRGALRDAWRLSAGLPPERTYFYCLYD
jgi:hypothetical protein